LHAKALKSLRARGVIGGALIFHAFRYHGFQEWKNLDTLDESLGWYFSPHWHALAIFEHSYNRCRDCPDFLCWWSHGGNTHGCKREVKCDGFEQLTRDVNKVDNTICKVEGVRRTIVGTLWYQLNHSSIRTGGKRFYPLTWFGVASYHKLHFVPEKEKMVCPLCGLPLVRIRYSGSMKLCTDECSPNFHRHLYLPLVENGVAVFSVEPDDCGRKPC